MGFFELLILLLLVGTPICSSVAVLAFLVLCVNDRIMIRRGEMAGREVSGLRKQRKRDRKRLLITLVICACSWALLIVLSAMTLSNM